MTGRFAYEAFEIACLAAFVTFIAAMGWAP